MTKIIMKGRKHYGTIEQMVEDIDQQEAEIKRLTAELERLREAGDAMADKVENGLISDGVNLWDNARAALGETQ